VTLFWSSSYRISDGATGSISKYVPSRAVVRMKLREPGAAMLLRPTERERKHDWDGNSKHRRRVVKIRSCGRLMPQRLSAA